VGKTRYRGHYDLYSSSNVIQVIKSRWMRWAWNVACIREKRDTYSVSVGKPEGKTTSKTQAYMGGLYENGSSGLGIGAWT